MVRQMTPARPNWLRPKTAIALILFMFSGGMLFFAASTFNDMVQEFLNSIGLNSGLSILIIILIAGSISTIGYFIARKKRR